MNRTAGQVTLVTGAAGEIGAALDERLAAQGAEGCAQNIMDVSTAAWLIDFNATTALAQGLAAQIDYCRGQLRVTS